MYRSEIVLIYNIYIFLTESVIGIENTLYYWEMDSCTISVCVKIREKSVTGGDDGYVHVLYFRVTTTGYYGMYIPEYSQRIIIATAIPLPLLLLLPSFYYYY